ncbi:MAG: alpha/beta hydrolase, partial [bacterium]|nr:alpha/beta hydrolase [bacterium]
HDRIGAMASAKSLISPPLTDYLGAPWQSRIIPVTPSIQAPGADRAVIVHHADHLTRSDGGPLPRAALFLPGLGDSFFQTEHAQQWIDAGIEFYGLDMRAQGRAAAHLTGGPERIYDHRLRYQEISAAMLWLHELGHEHVTLIGHSTGGLEAAIYAADHPINDLEYTDPDVLILNSPWMEMTQPLPVRIAGSLLAAALSRVAPHATISTLSGYYVKWLHEDFGGEWSFDPAHKPVDPFPVRAGMLNSVRHMQARLRSGLHITQPVLLACSTGFGSGTEPHSPDFENTDVILNPAQMLELAPQLGEHVTIQEFEGGVHDLACSREPVRTEYTRAAIAFSLAN